MTGMAGPRSGLSVCAAVFVACLLFRVAQAVEISTGDGLSLVLDDATGAVAGVAVNNRALPLLAGQAGGLAVREWQYWAPAMAGPIARADFETAQGWKVTASAAVQRENAPVTVEHRTDGGADGSQGYVRAGASRQYGHGVSFGQDVSVTPGGTYAISWQGRVPALDATYIVYVRGLDAAGRDITTECAPPKGWEYSPYSKTHFRCRIAASRPAVWERFSLPYHCAAAVSAMRVTVCLWRGEYVDIDSIEVRDIGGARAGDLAVLAGPVVRAPDGRGAVQHVVASERQLDLRLIYSPGPAAIHVAAEVRDLSHPPRARALEIAYRLPLQTTGWAWHDDIRRQRPIDGAAVYCCDFSHQGHPVSRYPFSCITTRDTGLMLAMPLDCPAMERRYCRADTGFVHSVDVGLSPVTYQMGPGCAKWSLVISAVEPRWGFRAAAAKYYELFPDFFAKRAQREGTWLWPVSPDQIPQPEDFGLTFWETHSGKKDTCATAREKGIYVLRYIEPCGLRQWFPEVKGNMAFYPLNECLSRLKTLAGDAASTRKWSGGPEAETAQAVLSSLPETVDGTVLFRASNEFDIWAQWWLTNPSPYLPAPCRGSTCWMYEIVPALLDSDGVYVDSVGLATPVAYENHRPAHLCAAQTPLSFDRDQGKPCLPGASSLHDFLAWLARELRVRDKLIMMNIGADPPAYRFFAHTGDVLGGEVSTRFHPGGRRPWEVESDAVSCLRRTYAFRKPTTNLLQDGNWTTPVPAATHADIEQYIKHQMFYGFYPAVCTIGGEEKPGYTNWKRYLSSPEQYERDRGLFRKYIPVIRRLNSAGWEPVTLAWTSAADALLIERFGHWGAGELLLALRNTTAERQSGTVHLDVRGLGFPAIQTPQIAPTDLLSDQALSVRYPEQGGTAAFRVTVAGHDTLIVKLRAGTGEPRP